MTKRHIGDIYPLKKKIEPIFGIKKPNFEGLKMTITRLRQIRARWMGWLQVSKCKNSENFWLEPFWNLKSGPLNDIFGTYVIRIDLFLLKLCK